MQPLISVIIPTRNSAHLIHETIASVLAQTVQDLEIIVVDNYSTDHTKEVVGAFTDQRVRYVSLPERDKPLYQHGGVIAAARNRGVRESQGELLAFLDSDDTWAQKKLELQRPHLDDPTITCVATDFEPMGDVGHTKRHLFFAPGEPYRDYDHQSVILGNPVMTSSALVRKQDFLEAGGFDESPYFSFIEDWELWVRLARKGRIRILSERALNYRVAQKNNRDMREVTLNYLKIFEKHQQLGILSHDDFKRACGNSYVTIGKAFLDKNDSQALPYYWKGFRQSVGQRNKLRALVGVLLACLPKFLRDSLLEAHYRLHAVID
jgi:glycosyltransferase involved in cell wall biosynthesis